MTTLTTRGIAARHNTGKPRWTLVHFESLVPLVRALEHGAKKYEKDNWKLPMKREVILDSAMRHLTALVDGEDIDTDSGVHHIGLLMANCMIFAYHNIVNKDDEKEEG